MAISDRISGGGSSGGIAGRAPGSSSGGIAPPAYSGGGFSVARLNAAADKNKGPGPAFTPIAAILTYASRPVYAVGNLIAAGGAAGSGDWTRALRRLREVGKNTLNFNPATAWTPAVPGLGGEETLPSETGPLRALIGRIPNRQARGAARLTADLGLDPLTYVTFGAGGAARGLAASGARRVALRAGAGAAEQRIATRIAEAEARQAAAGGVSVGLRVPFARRAAVEVDIPGTRPGSSPSSRILGGALTGGTAPSYQLLRQLVKAGGKNTAIGRAAVQLFRADGGNDPALWAAFQGAEEWKAAERGRVDRALERIAKTYAKRAKKEGVDLNKLEPVEEFGGREINGWSRALAIADDPARFKPRNDLERDLAREFRAVLNKFEDDAKLADLFDPDIVLQENYAPIYFDDQDIGESVLNMMGDGPSQLPRRAAATPGFLRRRTTGDTYSEFYAWRQRAIDRARQAVDDAETPEAKRHAEELLSKAEAVQADLNPFSVLQRRGREGLAAIADKSLAEVVIARYGVKGVPDPELVDAIARQGSKLEEVGAAIRQGIKPRASAVTSARNALRRAIDEGDPTAINAARQNLDEVAEPLVAVRESAKALRARVTAAKRDLAQARKAKDHTAIDAAQDELESVVARSQEVLIENRDRLQVANDPEIERLRGVVAQVREDSGASIGGRRRGARTVNVRRERAPRDIEVRLAMDPDQRVAAYADDLEARAAAIESEIAGPLREGAKSMRALPGGARKPRKKGFVNKSWADSEADYIDALYEGLDRGLLEPDELHVLNQWEEAKRLRQDAGKLRAAQEAKAGSLGAAGLGDAEAAIRAHDQFAMLLREGDEAEAARYFEENPTRREGARRKREKAREEKGIVDDRPVQAEARARSARTRKLMERYFNSEAIPEAQAANEIAQAMQQEMASVERSLASNVRKAQRHLERAKAGGDKKAVRMADRRLRDAQRLVRDIHAEMAVRQAEQVAAPRDLVKLVRQQVREARAMRRLETRARRAATVNAKLRRRGGMQPDYNEYRRMMMDGWKRLNATGDKDALGVLQGEWGKSPARMEAYGKRISGGREETASLLPAETLVEIRKIDDRIKAMGRSSNNDAAKFFVRIGGMWKALALATPQRFLRDLLDDGIRDFAAGARNPVSYKQAAQIMLAVRRGDDLAAKTIRIRGERFTYQELYDDFSYSGAFDTGFAANEVERQLGEKAIQRRRVRVPGAGGRTVPIPHRPGQGLIAGTATDMNAMRDNWTRFGLYLEMRKAGWSPYEAAQKVIQYRFNYSSLAPFLQKVRSFTIPFLTFTWKSIPLITRQLATRPGFFSHANTIIDSMNQAGGDPDLSLLPSGARSSFAVPVQNLGPIGDFVSGAVGAEPGEPILYNPEQTMTFGALNLFTPKWEDARKNALGQLGPGIITPYEVISGNDTYAGRQYERVEITPAIQALDDAGVWVPGGFGEKEDAWTGETERTYSFRLAAALDAFPPYWQVNSLIPYGGQSRQEAEARAFKFFTGLNLRPEERQKSQFYADRYGR